MKSIITLSALLPKNFIISFLGLTRQTQKAYYEGTKTVGGCIASFDDWFN